MIVVDAGIFVSALWPRDPNHQASRARLLEIELSGELLAAPTLILPEVAGALIRRTQRPRVGAHGRQMLLKNPRLKLVTIGTNLAQHAADLAILLQLRGADAT